MNRIVFLLSALRLTGWSGSLYPRAAKNQAIHKVFLSIFMMVICSALCESKAMAGYYFNWWDTDALEKKKAYLLLDFRLSLSPIQSESVYSTYPILRY